MAAQVTSFQSMTNNSPVGTGTTVGATYLNGITSAINHLERLIWSDSETVPTESDFLFNATYDNTNWNRIDTNKAASRIRLDQYGGIIGERVASGANPITWADGRFPFEGYTKNLVIRTASATTLAVSWDRIALKHKTSGVYRVFPAGSVTITVTNTGANGIDTGAMAANTLYYVNIIAKDDETLAACVTLASGTIHSQTFPTDYNWCWTVSFFRSNASSQIRGIEQQGNMLSFNDPYTHNLVNVSDLNSAAIQTANCSAWIPAGMGRMMVTVQGLGAAGVVDGMNVSAYGGDALDTTSGAYLSRCAYHSSIGAHWQIGIGAVMTNGSPNQQIKWNLSNADATADAIIWLIMAKVPTLMG